MESTPKQRYAVGIDLGTTNSAIAFINEQGQPQALRNSLGQEITPSALLFETGGLVVGQEAIRASAHLPDRFIDCFKRSMGSTAISQTIDSNQIPPEICSAMLLLNLKRDAESQIGPIHRVVISVPAFFDEGRRQATKIAGKLAGLEVMDIINEPTAAAIAHAHQRINFRDSDDNNEPPVERKYLVYDLGGGTFDVTILRVFGRNFQTMATDGDVYLGGKDFDSRLVKFLAESFESVHGFDPREDPNDHAQLWLDAEEIKKTLSARQSFKHTMYCKGLRHMVDFTRELFEDLTGDLIGRTKTTTNLVLKQAGLTWDDIDEVVLAGGSSRIPAVSKMLQDISGKTASHSTNADLMISFGAAYYASILMQDYDDQDIDPINLVNVNSHSLGVVGIDTKRKIRVNSTVVPKNTALPVTITKQFATAKTDQRSVFVRVVEGESEDPLDCIELGSCKISNLPPQLPRGTKILVEFNYLADGTLQVAARLPKTRQSTTATIERTSTMDYGSLSEWLERLTGQSDSYLSEQEKQQKLDRMLKSLGKKWAVESKSAAADELKSKIKSLQEQQKQLNQQLAQPRMDGKQRIQLQSQVAQLGNQSKSLSAEMDYLFLSLGREMVTADGAPASFGTEIEAIKRLLEIA